MTEGTAHSNLKHWLGFLGSGTLAFVVDAGVLKILTVLVGVPVYTVVAGVPVSPARIISISVAMVAGWLSHRRFTFRVTTPPTIAEFMRYVGVGWSASAINYAAFAALLFIRPTINVILAMAIGAVFAMVASYLGMRFAAFRESHR